MFVHPPLVDDPRHDAIRLADWAELNILLEEEEVISVEKITYSLGEIPPDASDDSEDREYFHDRSAEEAENAFVELNARHSWLGVRYPLKINKGVALLRHESRARDIYRFLILLRARQMYPGHLDDDGKEAGFLFEEIVSRALGAYIAGDQVRFGLADGQRGGGLPHSTVYALRELSLRMHEHMTTKDVSAKPQDFGADAVAWKLFGDDHPGKIILIGQATISEKTWIGKEPSSRWLDQRLVQFLVPPIRAVAFAETLSLTSRSTLEETTFSSIPFDRLRLLSVLTDENIPMDLRDRMNQWSNRVRMILNRR